MIMIMWNLLYFVHLNVKGVFCNKQYENDDVTFASIVNKISNICYMFI